MSNIIDTQTIVLSVNFNTLTINGGVEKQSIIIVPINLRFAADCLLLKSISYSPNEKTDLQDIIQIGCNITNDNIIGAFPNFNNFTYEHNDYLRLNNTFQTGNLQLNFMTTENAYTDGAFGAVATINPQRLISNQVPQRTFGVGVFTFQFLKLKNKELY
jgi:hypothetical protein